jgi:glycerol-3-phosphate dehydrogenase (NAD(P)+)
MNDMLGSSWSVILKNVYAIMFGVSDELKLGDNMRGHLMVAASSELSAIVKAFGAEANTPYGYAGLGDF